MCLDGAIETSELKSINAPLKTRRTEILARLSAEEPPSVIQLHPGAVDAYRRLTEDLQQALEGDAGEDLRTELRKLIESVDFIPLDGLGKFDLRVHGSQVALLTPNGSPSAESPASCACGALRCLGAGAGFARYLTPVIRFIA